MREAIGQVSLKILCGLFERSRQSWYEVHKRNDTSLLQEELVLSWVRQIRTVLPRLGCVKLLHILKQNFQDHQIGMGRDGFSSLLRKHDMLIQSKKKYVVTTNSFHHYKKWSDLVNRTQATKPEQIWVSDITYLRTVPGFIYLFLITDAYSHKIVGYHLSQTMKASGCLSALNKAIAQRLYRYRTLIHHSDRGIQYCCDAYVSLLQRHRIQISMTQSGSPYDNAIAERVNGILKSEFGLSSAFDSYAKAVDATCKAIARYNCLRPHLSCRLASPQTKHEEENNTEQNANLNANKVNLYSLF
jgi:transposase InsO family protein